MYICYMHISTMESNNGKLNGKENITWQPGLYYIGAYVGVYGGYAEQVPLSCGGLFDMRYSTFAYKKSRTTTLAYIRPPTIHQMSNVSCASFPQSLLARRANKPFAASF